MIIIESSNLTCLDSYKTEDAFNLSARSTDYGEQKANLIRWRGASDLNRQLYWFVPPRHSVEVTAESIYEATPLGVSR